MTIRINFWIDQQIAIAAGRTESGHGVFDLNDTQLSTFSKVQRDELSLYMRRSSKNLNHGDDSFEELFHHDLSRFDGMGTIKEVLDARIAHRKVIANKQEAVRRERLSVIVDNINECIERGAKDLVKLISNARTIEVLELHEPTEVYLKSHWKVVDLTASDISAIQEFDPECAEEAEELLEECNAIKKRYNQDLAHKEWKKSQEDKSKLDQISEANKLKITGFVNYHCTVSQQERFAAGFLSVEELKQCMTDVLLPDYGSFELQSLNRVSLTIKHDHFCEDPVTIEHNEPSSSLTEQEYNILKMIKVRAEKKITNSGLFDLSERSDIFSSEDNPLDIKPYYTFNSCRNCQGITVKGREFNYAAVTIKFAGKPLTGHYMLSTPEVTPPSSEV